MYMHVRVLAGVKTTLVSSLTLFPALALRMEASFHGKRVLVTGAGRGIGREVATRLYKYGAEVVALSRTEIHLKTLKEECPNIQLVVADVAEWEETRKAVENVGPVDMLVNNAGMNKRVPFGDITEEDFDSIMNINLKGALNIMQVVSNGMKARGTGGSIVIVSSTASNSAMKTCAVYCASKAGLDQMSRVMAVELGPHKIRVNTVNPGVVLTDMSSVKKDKNMQAELLKRIPLHRFSECSDVVDAIVFLLSDKAAMVHGASLSVDGGHVLG